MAFTAAEFVEALQKGGRRLFHFTDARNMASIREKGLLPTRTIRQLGLPVITEGDGTSLSIDQSKGLDALVSLSFCRGHPMAHVAREEGRIEAVRIIMVCPSVLLRPGAMVADQVATANAATFGSPDEMLPKMDLEATYQRLDWRTADGQARRAAAEKWEALIPGVIAPDLLRII